MNVSDIRQQRMLNQQISHTLFTKPEEIVNWMVAMQAQEYAQAKWAIGLRLPNAADAIIENAFNEGKILRTHAMRPTWHFVSPKDIRWLQALTAHRVHKISGAYYKKEGIDAKVMKKCNETIEKALQGNNHLTRNELKTELEKVKIKAEGHKLSYLMMQAELNAIICSGPRQGKQFTYALLEERAPKVKAIDNDEALEQLTLRYYTSRGPATVQDFVWWSGLTTASATKGIEAVGKKLDMDTVDGKTYYFSAKAVEQGKKLFTNILMPDYDEYGIAYRDRSAVFTQDSHVLANIFGHTVLHSGIAIGTWKRTGKNNELAEVSLGKSVSKAKQQDIKKAAERYQHFVTGG